MMKFQRILKILVTCQLITQLGHLYQFPTLFNAFVLHLMIGNIFTAFQILPVRWILAHANGFYQFFRTIVLWPIALHEYRKFVRDARTHWGSLSQRDRDLVADICPQLRNK